MAILAYFEKAAEDPRMIRYRWGDSPTELERELVMEKETSRLLPGDEPPTIQLMAAARKIHRLKRDTGLWPERGMTAS